MSHRFRAQGCSGNLDAVSGQLPLKAASQCQPSAPHAPGFLASAPAQALVSQEEALGPPGDTKIVHPFPGLAGLGPVLGLI